MVDEAAVYAASFESAQKDLSSAFEGEFCSSPRRFEPILQLIKLIVPSYVDEVKLLHLKSIIDLETGVKNNFGQLNFSLINLYSRWMRQPDYSLFSKSLFSTILEISNAKILL